MGKNSLRTKVDGNELDLSFSELKEVPVKELAAIPKATHIDLSQNALITLPPSFCALTHIVKLDFGQNQISELPANFGNLENLQHLDLYSNKLKVLPESFYKLERLKFLDLKNNPLDPRLAAVAGDCLDEKQCQQCARKVVEFMAKIHDELEKQREKKRKIDKDKEVKKLAAEEKAKEKQRLAKKIAKEKRKEEIRMKLLSEKKLEQALKDDHLVSNMKEINSNGKSDIEYEKVTSAAFCSMWKWMLLLILLAFISVSACYINQPEATLKLFNECKLTITNLYYKYSEIIVTNSVYYFDFGRKFISERIDDLILWLRKNKYFE